MDSGISLKSEKSYALETSRELFFYKNVSAFI